MEYRNTGVCGAECVQELPGFPAASAWKHFSRNHGSAEKLGGGLRTSPLSVSLPLTLLPSRVVADDRLRPWQDCDLV